MAVTIASSVLVSSESRTTHKQNLYAYTLSNGEVIPYYRNIPLAADDDANRVATGQEVLDSLVRQELASLLEGV